MFNKFIIPTLVLSIISCELNFSAEALIVTKGTAVDVVFPYMIDGGSLTEGASVVIEIAQDYQQNGTVIFKSGQRGTATLDKLEHRELLLGGGTLKAVNGEQVKVTLNKQAKGKGIAKSPSFWVGLLLFWPALFFIRTKEPTIQAGTTTQAFVMQDTELTL